MSESGCDVRPSLSVAFDEIKAAAMLSAKGRVLVYAHEGETARGCGWLQDPTPVQVEGLMNSLKGEIMMEEMYLGQNIV